MPLASLISNLFTTDSPQQRYFSHPDKGSWTNVFRPREHGQDRDTTKSHPGRKKEQSQAMEAEEEAQPPYLHVCTH